MPHAVVIHCLAHEPIDPATLHGGQLQGAFLDLIRQVDPDLSAELHDGNTLRQYAVAMLRPRLHSIRQRRRPPNLQQVTLRVACLDDRIYPAIVQWAMSSTERTARLKLGRTDFQITRVLVTSQSGEPWAGYATFNQLTNQASDKDTFIRLEFATPTCFRQGSRDEALPLPRHVFGGLARRWNSAFYDRLPIPLEPPRESGAGGGFLGQVEDHIVMVHPFEFRSGVIDDEGGRKVTGFVGCATYRITGRPGSGFVHLVNLLADAAFFMGLGKKTSRGCGTVRRIECK